MKLGMPQLYEFDTIEDNLKLAKELNLDFIELNLNFSYCRKEMEGGNLKALLDKYNILATLHFYDEADFGTYQEVVDAYLIHLERYAKLGKDYIRSINIHNIPGPVVTISGVKNYIYLKEFDEYSKRLINNLKKAEAICNKYGIILVIENTEGLVPYMEKTYELEAKEGFKFCYDCGHDNVSPAKLNDWINKYNLHFYEFHFHDGIPEKCHLALGLGTMDKRSRKNLCLENDSFIIKNDPNNETWVNLEVKKSEDLRVSVKYFNSI